MRRPFWRPTAPAGICSAPITRAVMSRCIRSRRAARLMRLPLTSRKPQSERMRSQLIRPIALPLSPHIARIQDNVLEPPRNNPGPNVILQYRFNAQTGRLSPNTPHRVDQGDLIGPRHYIHHPSLDVVYFSNEQGCTVTAYRLDRANG